jgi:hypothetical protein
MFGTMKRRKKAKLNLNFRTMSPKISHIIGKNYRELGIPFWPMIILWKDVIVDETSTQLMSRFMVSNRYVKYAR